MKGSSPIRTGVTSGTERREGGSGDVTRDTFGLTKVGDVVGPIYLDASPLPPLLVPQYYRVGGNTRHSTSGGRRN